MADPAMADSPPAWMGVILNADLPDHNCWVFFCGGWVTRSKQTQYSHV